MVFQGPHLEALDLGRERKTHGFQVWDIEIWFSSSRKGERWWGSSGNMGISSFVGVKVWARIHAVSGGPPALGKRTEWGLPEQIPVRSSGLGLGGWLLLSVDKVWFRGAHLRKEGYQCP